MAPKTFRRIGFILWPSETFIVRYGLLFRNFSLKSLPNDDLLLLDKHEHVAGTYLISRDDRKRQKSLYHTKGVFVILSVIWQRLPVFFYEPPPQFLDRADFGDKCQQETRREYPKHCERWTIVNFIRKQDQSRYLSHTGRCLHISKSKQPFPFPPQKTLTNLYLTSTPLSLPLSTPHKSIIHQNYLPLGGKDGIFFPKRPHVK